MYHMFMFAASGIGLDCTLLIVAQNGLYIYCMFSIFASYFSISEDDPDDYSVYGLFSEILSLVQTSLQTLFILNRSE